MTYIERARLKVIERIAHESVGAEYERTKNYGTNAFLWQIAGGSTLSILINSTIIPLTYMF